MIPGKLTIRIPVRADPLPPLEMHWEGFRHGFSYHESWYIVLRADPLRSFLWVKLLDSQSPQIFHEKTTEKEIEDDEATLGGHTMAPILPLFSDSHPVAPEDSGVACLVRHQL